MIQVINRLKFLLVVLSAAFLVQSCSWLTEQDNPAIKNQFNDTVPSNADSTLYLFPRNFFLVTFEFSPLTRKLNKKDQGEFTRDVLIPGYSYIDSLRQSGVPIFGGVFAVQQGCAFIIQADNNEKLHNLLKACPLNEVSKISTTPLISFGQHLFELRNKVEMLTPQQPEQ